MSYQLCPNFINTIFNEIPLNKCYHHQQPTETFQHLPLLTGFFYILLIILLMYTNILNNVIVLILRLILRLIKFSCTIILLLTHLPSLSNVLHSFKHLLFSLSLSILLYILSFLLYFLYFLNCIIYILKFFLILYFIR